MTELLHRVYREERARMLAALIRVLGDFELAEDALQDACAAALAKWGSAPPDDPVAWLLTRPGTARSTGCGGPGWAGKSSPSWANVPRRRTTDS
jgi:predicted RNA polymerase sigma factor